MKPMTMKTFSKTLAAAVLLATASHLPAAEPSASARPASAEFERMKSLIGTWTGKADMGQGPIDMTLQYRLLAGGSVIEEKVFAGTPNEMTTMYYDKDGRLALTHYCIFGNRPGMVLEAGSANSLKFKFDETCGINVKKESHMHALTIRFDDADTITTTCRAFIDGQEVPEKATTMKRSKADLRSQISDLKSNGRAASAP